MHEICPITKRTVIPANVQMPFNHGETAGCAEREESGHGLILMAKSFSNHDSPVCLSSFQGPTSALYQQVALNPF